MTVRLLGSVLLLASTIANALSLATAKEKNFIPRSLSPDNESRHQPRDVKHMTSYNWNGGEVAGPRFASVTAEVVIPNITFPYGYNSSAYYASSVWVGIGGDQNTCDSPNWANNGGLIQGGYYYLYDKEGDFGVFAFYEWFPNPPIFLDDTEGILTDIGDHVRMTVTQKDNTTGTFTWENLTQDKKFEVDLAAPVNGTLCTNHAEWIIETFMTPENPDSYFPDFGELSFTNIKAVSEAGKAASLADGIIVAAEPKSNSGRYLTSCEIVELDGTTCRWLGYKGIFD
ncbi:concanavalin A-like lectin/glucanase domain-containing protein [Ilyonectria destructans]|nr:concanavalin A-like lectin/glucanase domain-containing protein [Ilyonectria destructans]